VVAEAQGECMPIPQRKIIIEDEAGEEEEEEVEEEADQARKDKDIRLWQG